MDAVRRQASRIADPEDALYGDITPVYADFLTLVLRSAAELEAERRCGLPLHAHATEDEPRHAYRNGYRDRRVQTECATVTIKLPRIRGGGFLPGFLTPRRRALRHVVRWVYQALMCGVSASELSRLLERLTGFVPSRALLSEVAARLDADVAAFRQRPLSEPYQYLFLDAAWVKDLVGRTTGRVCVLMAIGVTPLGRKEILGFERVSMESAGAWRGFLTRLVARGLSLRHLDMVISDGHRGIIRAVEEVLGDVPHQLCWAHRMRNIRDAARAADRPSIIGMARDIYQADTLHKADLALSAFDQAWRDKYPAVVNGLRRDARYLLAFYAAPRERHEYLRTTNPIERTFREVRRWRRGCGAFTSQPACNRLFYKVAALLNDRWSARDIWSDPRRRPHTPPPTPLCAAPTTAAACPPGAARQDQTRAA